MIDPLPASTIRGGMDIFASHKVDRRTVLIGGGSGAGLLVGYALWPRPLRAATSGETVFNPFVRIGQNGIVTVIVPQTEYGQGVTTALPQILADELGADWRKVTIAPAPIHAAYANPLARGAVMLTGGSTSIRAFDLPYRQAGAAARALLQMTAAKRFGVKDWDKLRVEDGFVHGPQGMRLEFGDLANEAAGFDLPAEPRLRKPGSGQLVGKALPRLDTPAKVDGSAVYAGDVRLPGLIYASVRQGVAGRNRNAAQAVRGVLDIVEEKDWVAVTGTSWWAANKGLEALAPALETHSVTDGATMEAALSAALASPGSRIHHVGNIDAALGLNPQISATYEVAPALHGSLETRTATARLRDGQLDLWVATQAPGGCRAAVARATGLAAEKVTLIPTMAGGHHGIGFDHDAAVQAAILAIKLQKPVQLIWSRAEEIAQDRPRAPARATMTATLDAAGNIQAFKADIAAPLADTDSISEPNIQAVRGALPPYAVPHRAVDYHSADIALATGHWRGQADSYNCFFTECFVDEMAAHSALDPLDYRLLMLDQNPALARCLTTAARLGGWNNGSGQGLACHAMRGSFIAVMVTAEPTPYGLRIERIAAAVDVGRVINPALVRQQIEGGLIFGLAAALGSTGATLAALRLPRLAQTPELRIELLTSDRAPGGVSELGVPAVAPALANAYHSATGQRIRRLPFSLRPII